MATVDQWDLDVLIANAGLGQTGPLASIPIARLRAVFEVNVFGTFAITQRVAAAMKRKRGGLAVTVSARCACGFAGALDYRQGGDDYCNPHALLNHLSV